jgi:hypothetical protein
MAYPYIVLPDMEEGIEINHDLVRVAYNDHQVEDAVLALSNKTPNATICIYRLHELRKLKTKPTYASYTVNDKFEIIPK